MIENLPVDLQQVIYNKLSVRDKAMFRIAMPKILKPHLKQASCHDKALGLVAKALKTRKIANISDKVKSYIREYIDENDPTIEELQTIAPNIKECFTSRSIQINKSMTYDDIVTLIKNSGTDTSVYDKLVEAKGLYSDGITLLQMILTHNKTLLKALHAERPTQIEQYKMQLAQSLAYVSCNFVELSKILSFTKDELDELYTFCLNNCYFESAEIIERVELNV